MADSMIRLKVEGKTAAIANIYIAHKNVVTRMQRATVRNGNDTRLLAFQLAPKDTWFMANHIEVEFTPQYRGFEVFLDPAVFYNEGLPFYPPYVEHGTSISPAQPFMRPAYEIMSVHYQADISAAIKQALRESSRA